MREIKFRAWDKEEEKMIYTNDCSGTYSFDFDNDSSLKCCSNNPYCDTFGDEHDDWKVLDNIMQYTGLHDKKGKEIYEGDIVNFSVFDYTGSDRQYTGIVKFSECEFQLWKSAESEYYGSDGAFNLYSIYRQDDELEIIGNQYENPES